MNFMPSEDAFFEEPVENVAPKNSKMENENSGQVASQILESSVRQEKLLERILSELERMNKRINLLENSTSSAPKSLIRPDSPTFDTSSKPSRGTLVLPPGSRPVTLANVGGLEKAPVVPTDADREREEQEAIFRRRAEEQVRLARIESERIEREAEEERKRIAELERIQQEKRMKEELEKKTRGLMSGLLTGSSAGLFADDDLDAPAAGAKKSGGLFDDD
jgi:hypothetical protein